jgi:tRNA nucleotidyltransferase (CCA-adding enzyme)
MSPLLLPFSPETWPFSLDLLPTDACLVGGSVRDQLLHRPTLDLDFVLPSQAVETADKIAQSCGAGFVLLDEQRQIARVVFKQVTADFAQQQGDSLEADLRRRDFTINAIAYSPHQQTLFDPLGGKADIARQTLRMVSYENLAEDPLRLLRAYRQAAQLGFTLAPDTCKAIAQLAAQLTQVSPERVRSELDALLSVDAPKQANEAKRQRELWQSLLKNRLLQPYLPQFTAERIEQIEAIDQAQAYLQQAIPDYAQTLKSWLKPVPAGCDRSWIKATKLSRLVSNETITAQHELEALRYSRTEGQVILTLLKAQADLAAMLGGELTRSQQFFLFKLASKSFPAVSLLALSQGVDWAVLKPMIEKFLNPTDEIAHSRPLLTGTHLVKALKKKPGPEIGAALKAVEQAQAAGEVHSADEAIAWLKQLQK